MAERRVGTSRDSAVQVRALANAYAANANRPVAYIDETSLPPALIDENRQGNVAPFYAVTAFVVPAIDQENMRNDLLEIVGTNYWHSTNANQSETGRAKLRELANYIAEGSEPIIISSRSPIEPDDTGSEKARSACLTALAVSLHRGNHGDPVRLFVLERRQDLKRRNRDGYAFSQARKAGLLSGSAQLLQVSPSHERLLWLPDIVSYAYYRKVAANQPELFAPLEHMVSQIAAPDPIVLEAESLLPLENRNAGGI